MTRRIVIFLLAALCATAHAQTIRTLGYNSTNGQVVTATNVVWTNAFSFSTNAVAAQVRTNLGLGLSALTNTNSQSFLNAVSAATATNWSGDVGPGAADRAQQLIGNDSGATALIYDEVGGDLWQITNAADFQSALFAATGSSPTNTNTPDAWVDIVVGTNGTYKLPLYK